MGVQVRGVEQFTAQMKRVAQIIPQGDLAEALEAGGWIIANEAKDNVLRQDLVKSGALYESIKPVPIGKTAVDIMVGVPHGAVHEFGLPKGGKGVHSATAKQIRFFWAMWLQTGESMWKALALKKGYTIPPRPYLTPAVKDKKDEAVKQIAIQLAIALSNKLMRA